MLIRRIRFVGFRNLRDCLLDLSPRCTVLWGSNAQGKTNLLEGIYFVAALRSFRPGKIADLIEWTADRAELGALVRRGEVERHIEVALRPGGRTVRIDGHVVRDYVDAAGHLVAVLFAPEHLALVRGAAALRRQFLDRALANAQPAYYRTHRAFVAALRNRNALLRAHAPECPPRDLLASFDAQLAEYAAAVTANRHRLVEELCEPARAAHARIAPRDPPLSLRYASNLTRDPKILSDPAALREITLRSLAERLHRDAARSATSVGPQYDDLELLFEGRPLRLAGSQGQQRTAALALKLAEVEWTRASLGTWPILLLDDVIGELDGARQRALLDFVADSHAQVVVTTTDGSAPMSGSDVVWVRVQNGTVAPGETP